MLITEGEKSESVVEKLIRDRYDREELITEQEEATGQKETQAEDESKSSRRVDDIISGYSSEEKVSLCTLETFSMIQILN